MTYWESLLFTDMKKINCHVRLFKNYSANLCFSPYSQYVAFLWKIVDLPATKHLKKTVYHSLSIYQLPTILQYRWDVISTSPSMWGFCLSCTSIGLFMILKLVWVTLYNTLVVSSLFINHKEEERNVLAENRECLS